SGFHPDRSSVLGVPWSLAVELTELPDILERQSWRTLRILDAREKEHRIKKHRCVAVGQDETITIEPGGVLGIKLQKFLPQGVCDRRKSHGRAGMTGIGPLHRVHGERADCVDRNLPNPAV